jgi:hypothetical protein
MKNFIITIYTGLLLTFQLSISQATYAEEEGDTYQIGTIDTPFIRVSSTTGNNIVGSIYLNEEWDQATIIDKENKKKIRLLARFNAYHSEIEILKEKDIIALYPNEKTSVLLNNRTFVPIKIKDRIKPIFAEVLSKGKYDLYRVFDIKINKAPSDAKLLNVNYEDRVVIVSNLFFKNNDNTISKFPTRKKNIQQQLPPEILELAKKNKYSLKKEKDIIDFYEFINSQ